MWWDEKAEVEGRQNKYIPSSILDGSLFDYVRVLIQKVWSRVVGLLVMSERAPWRRVDTVCQKLLTLQDPENSSARGRSESGNNGGERWKLV